MKRVHPYQRALTAEDINELPLTRYQGTIHLIDKAEDAPKVARILRRESLLGFDTETKPSFKKGQRHLPALLQLASDKEVYLFHLTHIGLPKCLTKLLADPAVVKTGVAVDDDVKQLGELTPFTPAGFVDLGEISRKLKLLTNGLRNLAANLLDIRISKGSRNSNWGAPNFTRKQIIYAATDAWVGRAIYLRMQELGFLDVARDIQDNGSHA
ncbi:MAG: 3'-5' exonuclease domain-containing protein 2 [Desulfovibrio sp.]|nr:MAG: 3'-5' exonuclease domain-containing protein 2 [Desulfovibrio sp.]